MSEVGVQDGRNVSSRVRVRIVVLTVAALALLVATLVYVRVGWWRMESACSLDSAQGSYNSVSYGWSWQPLGFQCTYDNGQTETSIWF